MSVAHLPADVVRFVREHIHSVEQLEVLALLCRTRPRDWSASEVAREIRTNEASVARRLEDLRRRAFVCRVNDAGSARYRFEPDDADLCERIETMLGFYRTHRVSVYELMFAGPNPALQALADAFVLRRKKGK